MLHTSCRALNLGSKFHGRRLDPSRADMALARRWLNECEWEHNGLCKTSLGIQILHTNMKRPLELRVVDVQSMCLTTIPLGGRYLALSYRWSSSNTNFKTTNSNIDDLKAMGSLMRYYYDLPTTLQDAIDCTLELGERYVWIDALCIIRDCKADFVKYVRQMHRIYNNAIITLVAASLAKSGDTQADGLPGYRSQDGCFMQHTAHIQDLDLCTVYAQLGQTIVTNIWSQ
ncbi:hypothetical protein EK21DRAFT_73610 [Setomelanomma holmii]|uniref:Heterokaryon incompatibility domain-containing protein n=1 Tax=Setomelanomma holmii TaxID=210430 RepID=A0A9P4H422_9PLEO|nr:hypothetical protein EK21DRAFT_73610 [Setomelanomma holmii]